MCPGRTIRLNATAYCGKLFVVSFDRSELNHIHALDCMLSIGRNGGATNPVRLCSMGSTKIYDISPSVYFPICIWLAQRVSHTKMYIVFLLAFFPSWFSPTFVQFYSLEMRRNMVEKPMLQRILWFGIKTRR